MPLTLAEEARTRIHDLIPPADLEDRLEELLIVLEVVVLDQLLSGLMRRTTARNNANNSR
jgi:hypothetical protein